VYIALRPIGIEDHDHDTTRRHTVGELLVSSRSSNGYPAWNTDEADTITSNRIVFRGWEVDNEDDSIGV
jgi:hypothetical protein